MRHPARSRPNLEILEGRQLLASLLGLTTAGTSLVRFDSDSPGAVSAPIAISGLQAGETLLAIDNRALISKLYGLGSTGRLYEIDPSDGTTTPASTGPILTPAAGVTYDFDFTGGGSVLRLTSSAGAGLRYNVETGATTADPSFVYAPGDPGAGTTPRIIAIASSDNGVLFGIDAARDREVTQPSERGGGVDPSQLMSYFALNFDAVEPVGLEGLLPGAVFLAATLPGAASTSLYSLTPTNTAFPPILMGNFPAGVTFRDITADPNAPLVFAVNEAGHLISFASATPGHLFSDRAVAGLQGGEQIAAIAFRPEDGVLFGFGTTGRLYRIDRDTAIATAVSAAPITPAYDGSKPSIDFVSAAGLVPAGAFQIQLLTLNGQNLFIDPSVGVVTTVNPRPIYAPGDEAAGSTPVIASATYASYRPGALLQTTQAFPYAIDSARDTLIFQGVANNNGVYSTVQPLGRDTTSDVGFDRQYVTLTDAGATESAFYQLPFSLLNPPGTFGPPTLTRLGTVGGGSIVRDMAVVPPPAAGFISPTFTADLASGLATITLYRTGDVSIASGVTYRTVGGTAVSGVDYTPVQGLAGFAPGQTFTTFTVPLMRGAFSGGSRTIGLELGLTPPQVALLTITAPAVVNPPTPTPPLTPGVAATTFLGTAGAITGVSVRFNSAADATPAATPSRYVVAGVTAGRSVRVDILSVASATYDAASSTALLTFASPIALRDYRSLIVTAIGFSPGAASSTSIFTVQRGASVRYQDVNGDRVTFSASGNGAKVVVLRRLDGSEVSVLVDGAARVVSGTVAKRRGSDGRTAIARLAAGRAKLRLAKAITVGMLG